METRFFSDRRCLLHEAPGGFPESPRRLERILAEIEARGGPLELLEGPAARQVDEAVEAVHGTDYVERFRRATERGDGLLGSSDNPLSRGTWPAAWTAANTAVRSAAWVAVGADRHAFAAVRPPGHHAEREMAMGFCYFNNVAVAAEFLQRSHGVGKIAVLDFDVHHGNGTQAIFYERADVFYVSVHQFPFYPGTGSAGEAGAREGLGGTLNVPLAKGAGDSVYERAFEDTILPAVRSFGPELLLISAGFDAWRSDPLGGMEVSEDGFAAWGKLLGELARELCDGRIVSILEGGYDLEALPTLVVRYAEGVAAD